MLDLAFVLAIVALIAYATVASITPFNTKVVVESPNIRGFKNDELSTNAYLFFKRSSWINVNLRSVKSRAGVEARFEKSERGIIVRLNSKYSGRFTGLAFEFEARDILNLFSKKIETIYSDFVYESLPLSIAIPIPHAKPLPLAYGEKSGNAPGSSMELYSIEEYQPYGDTKNVMWKKVSRMPDEKLMVRIRDSNTPAVIRIAFVLSKYRTGEEKLHLIDLACEAAGMMGNSLLAAGCEVELMHGSYEPAKPIAVHRVSQMNQLGAAIMHLADAPVISHPLEIQFEVMKNADLVLCGVRELEDKGLAHAITMYPTIAIKEEAARSVLFGRRTIIYSGKEDLRGFISRVSEN
jgi:hypothetical protein